MRKLFLVFLTIFIILLSMSCQSIESLNQDLPVVIEITNIPNENNGWAGIAGLQLSREPSSADDPKLESRAISNIFSGSLKYSNGTEFKIKDVRRNTRYMAIFVLVHENEPTVTLYSKQFIINSGTIKLNFKEDFLTDPMEALMSYK